MITGDDSIMPFGKYAGRPLSEVPVNYLVWLYENRKYNRELRVYIEENLIRLISNLLFKDKAKELQQ